MRFRMALAGVLFASVATAQTAPRGWEMSALPATNFNSDEGFGYGITAQAYQYGDGTLKPYRYTIQPLVMFTTKGRRDFSVFFDAPHVLPGQLRLSGYLGREKHLATPYYGLGNATSRDESLEHPPNPYYYRFGRSGWRFNADLQRSVAGPLRALMGVGYRTTAIDMTPFDSGTTLLNEEYSSVAALSADRATTWRTGLVYDTRDRETGPTRGQWIELLYQHGSKSSRPETDFERITGTARVYVPIGDRLVWAQRIVAQNLSGTVEFYDMFTIQGSLRDDEGLGGSSSVRGLPKNRFIGRGMAFANEELRWRAANFRVRSRESAVILSAFVDAGRVWYTGLSTGDAFSDLHVGIGAGARFRYGQNFVVALDVARSKEATPIYIGLGYPF